MLENDPFLIDFIDLVGFFVAEGVKLPNSKDANFIRLRYFLDACAYIYIPYRSLFIIKLLLKLSPLKPGLYELWGLESDFSAFSLDSRELLKLAGESPDTLPRLKDSDKLIFFVR